MNTLVRKAFPLAAVIAPALLATVASMSAGLEDKPPELRKVAVGDGVELHYVERGKGAAVLFVHGTLGDYSTWDGVGPSQRGHDEYPRVATDRAGMTVVRDTTFLTAGPASERSRSAARGKTGSAFRSPYPRS